MNLVQINRLFKTGVLNVLRAPFVSFSAILIMTITLLMIGVTSVFSKVMDDVVISLRDKVDVTVYFKLHSEELHILELRDKVTDLPAVKSVEYTSKEEALEEYTTNHSDETELLSGLEILAENPFRATLSIKAESIEYLESISNFIQNEDILSTNPNIIVDKINFYENRKIIERLDSFIQVVEKFSLTMIIILSLISFIIVFNMIRLVIYLSKEEIKIMSIIGASSGYIRAPFLVSGVIYGVMGTIFSVIILYPIFIYVSPHLSILLDNKELIDYFYENLIQLVGIMLLYSVLIGIVSSYLSTRKHI